MYEANHSQNAVQSGKSIGNAFGKPMVPVLLSVLAVIAVIAFWYVKGAQPGASNAPRSTAAIPTNADTYPSRSAADTAVGQAAPAGISRAASSELPAGVGRNETATPSSYNNGIDNVSGAHH